MKKAIYILIPILGLYFSSKGEITNNLRKIFHESVLHADKLPLFIKEIEGIKDPTALEKAYIGASEALKAREAWNPLDKLNYIQKFREYLIEAIKNDSENLEIRFIRFAIEYNMPFLLRSKKTISEDKFVIMGNLSQLDKLGVDEFFVKYILRLFEDTKLYSEAELEMIKSRIKV